MKILNKNVKTKKNVIGSFAYHWNQMKFWNKDELCKLDWIVSMFILVVLFVSCLQNDLRLTGNRSFLLYDHFTDFYKASYEQSGGYYANYLPSTFIAFAIWNLPLYLIGQIPETTMTNSIINMMWYKLLPVILYYITSHIIYKISLEIGFGEKKSRLCKFGFLVFPIAVFSQFIFSQYDIFTVFFMMLGVYFYVKGGMWRFALMFGIAATFKYHAILYYLVLLLLKEKKIRDWLKYTVLMMLPLLMEVLPNISDEYFQKHVTGFGALNFVQKSYQIGFFNGINLVAAVAAFVLVWAYQKKTRDLKELFSWDMFFCVAISFSVFGVSSWNPQWLLIMVPFLVFNIFMNENGNMLVMITNIFVLALYIFSSQTMVDESILMGGIWKYVLPGSEFPLRMWDIYMFHDEELLCTAMWVVLLVYVVFGHPKYHIQKGDFIAKGLLWQIRCAFLFGVAAFAVPMTISAIAMMQGQIVLIDNSRFNLEADNVIALDENSQIHQEFVADGSVLSKIRIRVWNGEQKITDDILVKIVDKKTKNVIYETVVWTEDFTDNSALYTFVDEDIPTEEGNTYILEMSSDAKAGTGIGLYCVTADSIEEILWKTEARMDMEECRLQMRITGEK